MRHALPLRCARRAHPKISVDVVLAAERHTPNLGTQRPRQCAHMLKHALVASPTTGDARACQVKGCTSNLKTESLKHQRLRICAEHEKAMTVHVNGAASRFCQQCTKFHAIDNFDGNNRGCRKRLQKHNERCVARKWKI